MADNPVLDRVSGFAAQPVTRQVSLLAGFAASIALAIGVVNWASTPSYEPVYGAMSPADSATAISVLQTSGIKYRMEPGTGLLEVPYDDVLQARMALASEGFPRNGGGIGFESLYEEQQMGLSSFMEQARYHRAVEAELARTISAMDSVSGARVHLAIAKQSAFMRRGNEPSASVMVSLLPGVRLSERQLSGIIHLVASSIPNLDSDRVSVVDQAGKLLSSQGEDSDFGYTAEQFRLAQQFENSLNDRIMTILEPILGVGAVRAQVTADMDFTRIESTNEIYDPTTVLRSEQTTQDITNRGTGAGQAPGALVAQPPQQGALAVNQDPAAPVDNIPDRESTKETRNYEVNKTISHTRRVPGTIQKLSVAVVVDYVLDDNGERIALDQARIDQITALVREAIGFSAERGDTVQIINSPFIAPDPIEPIPEPGFFEQAWVWELGRGLLAALAVLALIFTVLRPMIRYSTSYTPPVLAAPSRLENAMAETGSDQDTLSLGGPTAPAAPSKPNYHQSVAMARNTAVEQPVRAAYVVKNWIAADG